MLSIELDKETEAYLVEILGAEKTTRDELIKHLVKERWLSLQPLVKERWLSLQPHQTIVERLGGHPEHLLEDASPDLSERANRKQAIACYLQKKYPQYDMEVWGFPAST
jgi:hypothetical protein